MSAPAEPISGMVASVLNDRDVALNIGSSSGVEVGMVFKILDAKGSDIVDPVSNESLGSVELTKTFVKVSKVQERISVASTFRNWRVNVGGSATELTALQRFFEPPKWETRVETLKLEQATRRELDERESYVKVGDPVIESTDSNEYSSPPARY